jgi:hypothetical protein
MLHMKTLILLLLAAATIPAQQPVPPDVAQAGTFTGVGNGTPIWVGSGGPNGAIAWRLTYSVDGTHLTAAQLAIQGADAPNSAGCLTATYATISTSGASIVENVNPSASGAQGNVGVKAYYPCIRARTTAVTGAAGTVTYQLAGWKYLFTLPVTITPAGTQDVNLTEVGGTAVTPGVLPPTTGLATAQDDGSSNTPSVAAVGVSGTPAQSTNREFAFRFNGATWDRDFICTNRAAFNLSASGNTEIVALTASTTIRICHVSFTTVAPEDIKFTQGTGTNCGTGTADLSGLYKQVTGLALDFTPTAALRSASGSAICVNQSVAQALGGIVVYAKY